MRRQWRVNYHDGQKETFTADSYDAVVGTFRNDGVSVAWVNMSAVKSVRLIPDTEKENTVRVVEVPQE